MSAGRGQGDGGWPRTCAAIAASALVHGLLLLALLLAPPPRAEAPPDPRPIEVVIVDAPRTVEAPATPSAGRGEPILAVEAPSAPEAPVGPPPSSGEELASPDEGGEGSPNFATSPSGGAPARSPGGPAAPERSLTLVPEERPIDDRFRLPKELDLRAPMAPAPGEPGSPAPPPLPEERLIERRLDEMFAEDRAEKTARHRADAYWFELRRRLERDFAPPRELIEAGPSSGSLGMRDAIAAYRGQAAAYGATGTPYGDAPLEPGGRRGFAQEMVDEAATRVFSRPLDEAIGDTSLLARTLVAVIELEQDAGGSLAEARLISSSGIPAYDELALGHARSAAVVDAAALGPPPAQGRRTRWAFTSALRVVPPAPIAGCSFDAYFVPQNCFYPLKKFVRHRVLLLAVYDDWRR